MSGKAVQRTNDYANNYLRGEKRKFIWRMVAIVVFAIILNIALIANLGLGANA